MKKNILVKPVEINRHSYTPSPEHETPDLEKLAAELKQATFNPSKELLKRAQLPYVSKKVVAKTFGYEIIYSNRSRRGFELVKNAADDPQTLHIVYRHIKQAYERVNMRNENQQQAYDELKHLERQFYKQKDQKIAHYFIRYSRIKNLNPFEAQRRQKEIEAASQAVYTHEDCVREYVKFGDDRPLWLEGNPKSSDPFMVSDELITRQEAIEMVEQWDKEQFFHPEGTAWDDILKKADLEDSEFSREVIEGLRSQEPREYSVDWLRSAVHALRRNDSITKANWSNNVWSTRQALAIALKTEDDLVKSNNDSYKEFGDWVSATIKPIEVEPADPKSRFYCFYN